MPPHWIRLAQCEEGLNWGFHGIVDGIAYEGAFAFAASTWDKYRYPGYPKRAWQANPFQQWKVARRVAQELTIYYPWGCWRGPTHAWVRGNLPEFGVRT